MSAEAHKAMIARWRAALNQRDVATAATLMAPDFVSHGPCLPEPLGRLEAALSDLHFEAADELAVGDKVFGRWIARGRHTREVLGIQPTGKLVSWTGMNIFRIANGRIAEEWVLEDSLDLLRQLGVTWRIRPCS